MAAKKPSPPTHLEPATKRWFSSVVSDYVLADHHVRLLTLAAEAWDRAAQARLILAKEGICVRDDRQNVRAHPAVQIERDSRIAFARLMRELDLDAEPPSSTRRVPALASNRG